MSRSTSVVAACLNPPDVTELDASGALPPWILLETRVYFAHRDNSTAASAKTSRDNHEIVVSICFADPPALSYVCLHCPSLSTTNFVGEPRVVRSEKQFLLLHPPLTWTTSGSGVLKRSNEYYMYQVAQGKVPTLARIPDPNPCLVHPNDLGIYCDDAPGEFILAALSLTRDLQAYELHLYSSKSNTWTTKPARLANPKFQHRLPVTPHKVIPLGGSLLGWVDLWDGILFCDVLSRSRRRREVLLRFIPFPPRLTGNTSDHRCPWKVRDVAFANGSLKFVEIEHYTVPAVIDKSVVAADPPDIVYDDPPPDPVQDVDTNPPSLFGWRSVIWNRVLLSDNCWRLGCNVRFHDILVENPSPCALLAGDAAGDSKTIDLLPSFPNLSIHGDDVVHVNSLVRLDVLKRHMASINMRSKALKALVPCTVPKLDAYCPHFPCVLSSHLSNAPDLPEVAQASNSEKLNAAPPQTIQARHSQKITENECLRSDAHDEISAPSQAQNCGSNIDFSLAPQQSFGLWDMMASYNRSHRAYADGTRSIYGNNQWSWQSPQQPTYLPNFAPHPSWFSPGCSSCYILYTCQCSMRRCCTFFYRIVLDTKLVSHSWHTSVQHLLSEPFKFERGWSFS